MMRKFLLSAALALLAAVGVSAQSNVSYVVGEREAQQFAYGWGATPGAHLVIGNSATGAQTVMACPAFRATQDGREIANFPTQGFAPVSFDAGTASAETLTPTAISIVQAPSGVEANQPCAQITATFSFTHFQSQNVGQVRSGTFGLQEAIDDAGRAGGIVTVDNTWGGTNAQLAAAIPFPNVTIADKRNGNLVYWAPQATSTVLSQPATLTAVTALPSTTPVGTFTATAYNMCIAYVDLMGQEGQCSTSFVNTGAGATSSFIFSAPAASTGAVGYTIYIGLTAAGSTTLQYKVPLVTQPATAGPYPVSNGVCTLTTLETTTPACALTNATYGQTGSTATVSAITVNTSQIQPELTTASSTTVYIPDPNGRQVYAYAPGARMGTPGIPNGNPAFTITTAAATVTPNVIGTVNLPPGFMNYVGRTIELCGFATTTATASTIENIQFQWDAQGQNTAGKGVVLADLTATTTLATTGHIAFCQDFMTTVASASATGGSINAIGGSEEVSGVTIAGTNAAGTNTVTGATGSLNLADAARINVIYLHTTSTDGAGYILQGLSLKVVN